MEHYTYIQEVLKDVDNLNFESITDVGCGEGRIIKELESRATAASLTGVDVSERALLFAKGVTNNSDFYEHDITSSPLRERSDLIVSCEVIEHIPPASISDYVTNISKSLQIGGRFILTTPTTNVPVNKKHYQHFTLESLTGHLSPQFEIEKVEYLNKPGLYSKFLNRLIANRFYLSNSPFINRWVFNQYKRHCLHGNKDTGGRIFVRAIKK